MIIFELICDAGHCFEGWFKNADDLQMQSAAGQLSCPVCNSIVVTKKLTAANLTRKSNTVSTQSNSQANQGKQEFIAKDSVSPQAYQKAQEMLRKVHDYVDQNYQDVGNKFAEQAIGMHKGDIEQANIKGVASKQEVKEMAQEGVQAMPLPPKPVDPKKLN